MKKFDVEKITLNHVLTMIACFMAFMIVLSTIVGLCLKKSRSVNGSRQPVLVVAQGQDQKPVEYSSFKNMERIRIVPAGEKGQNVTATIIVTPYFSYTKDDKEFAEELSRKNPVIKSTIINYFSSKTIRQLKATGEDNVKEQLKELINQNLTLNKIDSVYFDEYIFLQ